MKFLTIITLSIWFCGTAVAGERGADAKNKEQTLEATVKMKGTNIASSVSKEFNNKVCTNGKHKRRVEISYGDMSTKLPCEVHYRKETEQPGHQQVLWSASNQSGYCESKAAEFINKLEGWGWSCAGTATAH